MGSTRTKARRGEAPTPTPSRRERTYIQVLRIAALNRTGFTQTDVGKACDPPVTRQTISLIVHDKMRSEDNRVEEKYAQLCGVELAALEWEPTPQQTVLKRARASAGELTKNGSRGRKRR